MNTILPMLLCAVAFVCLLIFFAQGFGPLIMSYKIGDSSLEVRLFGFITESKTQLDDIVEVKGSVLMIDKSALNLTLSSWRAG
jgi:hypothetical protein